MMKYGPYQLILIIRTILNNIFELHKDVDTGSGILTPINKPNKPKGPVTSLRAITLLPMIRKIFSNIVLSRIDYKTVVYLSKSQSAYTQFRSTGDIVWMHRWLISRIETYQERLHITGIDMSAAFDTIIRVRMIAILSTFLDEDEVRMIRYLLSNTTLKIKIDGANTTPFRSNIGSAQGDGLSGKLYTIYFEASLRELRPILDIVHKLPPTLPDEAIYADDADFIDDNEEKRKRELIHKMVQVLGKANLKVNETKTEFTTLERKKKGNIFKVKNTTDNGMKITLTKESESWRTVKKLGSLLGVTEDINRRKQLSMAALYKINNLWIRKDRIKQSTKLKLYKTLVKPVLLYNSGTWSPTQKEEEDLDGFHRKQLRIVLNVKYPVKMRSKTVYRITKEELLSISILRNRWKLFGHVLRMSEETPAFKSMIHYFSNSDAPKFRGRPRTNLPWKLNKDLEDFCDEPMRLRSVDDLQVLKNAAKDRLRWKNMTSKMCEAAKAAKNF